MNLLISNNHTLSRRRLSSLVSSVKGMSVIGEANKNIEQKGNFIIVRDLKLESENE